MTSTKKNNGFAQWLKESLGILAVLMALSSKTIGAKKENYKEEIQPYVSIENLHEALAFYQRYEKENTENAGEIWSDMAFCYQQLEEYDKAIAYYEKEIAHKAQNPKSYDRGNTQETLIKLVRELDKDPIEVLEGIASRVPNSGFTYQHLQQLCFRKKQYAKAVTYFKKARELSLDQQGFRYSEFVHDLFKKEVWTETIEAGAFSLAHIQDRDTRKAEVYNLVGASHIQHYRKENNNDEVSKDVLETARDYYKKSVAVNAKGNPAAENMQWVEQELKKHRKGFFGKLFGKSIK